MGTRDFLVWLFVYVMAMVILIYVYKNYTKKKLLLAEADQKFLQKYITDNHPDVTIKVYNGDSGDEYEPVDKEESPADEQPEEEEESNEEEPEEKEEEPVQESKPEESESTEEPIQEKQEKSENKEEIPIKKLRALAKKIKKGTRIRGKGDLQLQANYPNELEAEIKKLGKKKAIKPPSTKK